MNVRLCLAGALALVLFTAMPLSAEPRINEVLSLNLLGLTDTDGDYSDWIEIYNNGEAAVALAGYGLSDDPDDPQQWVFDGGVIQPGAFLIVFASGKDRQGSELHANFGIAAEGETVLLTGPGGATIDAMDTGQLPPDISRGRSPDGGLGWFLFSPGSPGAPNGSPFQQFSSAPTIDAEGGFFSSSLLVPVLCPDTQADIRYTLDSTLPGPDSKPYAGPILIDKTTVLRARCFEAGKLPSAVATRTWIHESAGSTLEDGAILPVISVVTDPDNLWDTDHGIYVLGDDYEPLHPFYGANFWQNWERPAHIEFWEPGSGEGFRQELGIKIHGNWTRAYDQKSLRLVPRGSYGAERIDYPIFGADGQESFRYLILRNGGNDWARSHIRDALTQEICDELGLDRQDYRPAIVYLNGEYWGIHNIRERQEEQYLADHHGVDPTEVDILERNHVLVRGDLDHWYSYLNFIDNYDGVLDSNVEHVRGLIDIDNFATYNIAEIFFGNTDWPGNNRRYWRPRTPGGRWRWFLIDTDLGLGLNEDYRHDYIGRALAENGGPYNPPWSTRELRWLMENATFRRDFINRYAELMSSTFLKERLLDFYYENVNRIETEIDRHNTRWGITTSQYQINRNTVRYFLTYRHRFARDNLMEYFALADTIAVNFAIDPPEAGRIDLTAVTVDSTWSGVYFAGNQIPMKAVAAPGHHFLGWSDASLPQLPEILLDLDEAYAIVALFGEGGPDSPNLVINEINYKSGDDFDPEDWVEIHNAGATAVDLSGWVFKDSDNSHVFTIPAGTMIEPQDYLVLCRNLLAFRYLFPEVANAIGSFDFGLSGDGELLRLYDELGEPRDQVAYGSSPPWPLEPNGGGPTLELVDPASDNFDVLNWAASVAPNEHGTPGAVNSVNEITGLPEEPAARLAFPSPYPNPFNPSTTIAFRLPASARVRLEIFDSRGRLVAELIDETLAAGPHEIPWRAEGLGSGVYLARLRAGDESSNRKLLLLK